MNKIVALLVAAPLACGAMAQSVRPAIPRDDALEAKIEKTLSGMSLDEKIGQMLQINIDVVGGRKPVQGKVDRKKLRAAIEGNNIPKGLVDLNMSDKQIIKKLGKYKDLDIYEGDPVFQLNVAKLDTIISKYKVGSFLNAPDKGLTREQWQKIIPVIQNLSMKYLKIPTIYGLDENHGSTYVLDGTLFPQPINLGASFNVNLARQMATAAAYESRAADCPWVFNPTLDLGRDPRWPRIWESFGEDAIVNARMVEQEMLGYQGTDNNHLGKYNVATSVKHYMAYGAPFSGKDRTPAYVSPLMLREKYFEPFKCAAKAGALTMMVNSASVNGVPTHANHELLTDWLKRDLNWDGMLITDWADISNLYQREHVAKDKKDAIRIAINAGIDMNMDPYSVDFCPLLKQLVQEPISPTSFLQQKLS